MLQARAWTAWPLRAEYDAAEASGSMLPTVRPRPLRELPRRKCSTGCPVLDAFLGGGLPCGQLIEITGGLAGLAGVDLHMPCMANSCAIDVCRRTGSCKDSIMPPAAAEHPEGTALGGPRGQCTVRPPLMLGAVEFVGAGHAAQLSAHYILGAQTFGWRADK